MRFLGFLGLACLVMGCGNVVLESTTGSGGGSGGSTTTTATTATGGGGTAGSGGGQIGGGGAGGGDCMSGLPDKDFDGDGFSPAQGDCNDCDPMIGPASVEAPTPEPMEGLPPPVPTDEDCDGMIDEPPDVCDDMVALDSQDPLDAARAIDLCSFVEEGAHHGVLSAAWVLPDGQPPPAAQGPFHLGHGVLPDLGPHALPQAGSRLLALSNGTARRPSDPEYKVYYMKGYSSDHPPGMPFEGPCPGSETGGAWDGIALEVQLLPPANALGLKYDFRFYTLGWPKDACLPYNDQFATLMSPPPPGLPTGNIAFDQLGNPITISFLTPFACQCNDIQCPGDPPCQEEAATLAGSGFDLVFGASTEWLTTAAPIDKDAESVVLRFTIYDAEDGLVDSTVLLDRFRWIVTPGQAPIYGGQPDD